MKNKITKFSLFRDWLQETLVWSPNRADVAASNIRTLEDYLAKNIKYIPLSEDYPKGNPAINKAMPIRGLYDYLDKLNRINNRGPKERLAIQAKIIADVKSAIVSILEFTQKIGKKEKDDKKEKQDSEKNAKIEVLNNLSNCRTTFAVYVKFLEDMYRLESMDEIVAEYFSKAGKKSELTPKKHPIGVKYFKKGIVRALRHVGVFLTDTESPMITMSLDTLTKLLDEYTKQYKQSHDVNDLGLFRGLSFVTSIGDDSNSSTSTNFKIQSWEEVFLQNAKINAFGERVCLLNNENVFFCPKDTSLRIYRDKFIREVRVPVLSNSRSKWYYKRYSLGMRVNRNISIHTELKYLKELSDLCHHILIELHEVYQGAILHYCGNEDYILEKIKKEYTKRMFAMGRLRNNEELIYDDCSDVVDVQIVSKQTKPMKMDESDASYLCSMYSRVYNLLKEYGSHYEIELVAE